MQACASTLAISSSLLPRKNNVKRKKADGAQFLLSFATSFLGFTVEDDSEDCKRVPKHSSHRDWVSEDEN